uniref:CD209b antigen n=1 Tax=Nannospalax galili TaxID=1026970 RepID=A0A8C6R5Z1_NANGA
MSDSTEARTQQLGALDDEEWMISGTNYSVKTSGSLPYSGIKSFTVSKISQGHNNSMQKFFEQLTQLEAELFSKIPISQGQNESMQKISEQLIQLKAELSESPENQGPGASGLILNNNIMGLKRCLISKITIIQKQDDSKQEKISQQLTQLQAQLYSLCCPCPWDWTSFVGNCYFFSMSQRNWNDAVTMGAQLVIIKSEEEQTFLQQTSKAKGRTWMGLSDFNKEAALMSYGLFSFQKYWNKGEPNNIGEEDCAEFSGDGWNDSKCDLRKFWICKKAETLCTTS